MFDTILRSHQRRYPRWRVQDLYKLVYQMAMGVEHMEVDPILARRSLKNELVEMGEGPGDDPMLDPISDDGRMIRVNLRPFQLAGGDINRLLEAYLQTSRDFHGDNRLLEACWQRAIQIQPFPEVSMTTLFNTMRQHNFPAVHHSDVYKQLYRPAYRVVQREFFKDMELGG